MKTEIQTRSDWLAPQTQFPYDFNYMIQNEASRNNDLVTSTLTVEYEILYLPRIFLWSFEFNSRKKQVIVDLKVIFSPVFVEWEVVNRGFFGQWKK